MTTADFMLLCSELETIASQVFDDETAPCQFEDDTDMVAEFEPDFNLWEDR